LNAWRQLACRAATLAAGAIVASRPMHTAWCTLVLLPLHALAACATRVQRGCCAPQTLCPGHEKRLPDDFRQPCLLLFTSFVFPIEKEDFYAFDLRSVFRRGTSSTYLLLPFPHIPIAALAANRVIIIVIHMSFYLSKATY